MLNLFYKLNSKNTTRKIKKQNSFIFYFWVLGPEKI